MSDTVQSAPSTLTVDSSADSSPVQAVDKSSPLTTANTSPLNTADATQPGEQVVEKPQDDTCQSSFQVGTMLNATGSSITTMCWKPTDSLLPKALLFISHGLAEHAGRYEHVAKAFTDVGIMVFSHDHVGHGSSEGERAQIHDFQIFTRDVIQHIKAIQGEYPNVPTFLYGHSMGSLIALDVILQKQDLFRGLLLSGMALKPDPNLIGPTAIFLAKIVAWVSPSVRIKKLTPEAISRDENEVRKYLQDPLVYTEGIKAGIGSQIINRAGVVMARLGEIHLPILVFHGENDTLTFVGNSHLLYNAVQSEDKQIKIWPGARHELHNEIEPDRTHVIQSYVRFVQDRI